MITLTITDDGVHTKGGTLARARATGFTVSAESADEIIEILERALNPSTHRPLAEWRRLAKEQGSRGLNGWRHGTAWINGTPAPVVASWMRPGVGLVKEETAPPPSPVERIGGHELALCKACRKVVALAEIESSTRRENRKGFFGTCHLCIEAREAA